MLRGLATTVRTGQKVDLPLQLSFDRPPQHQLRSNWRITVSTGRGLYKQKGRDAPGLHVFILSIVNRKRQCER